MASTTYLQQAYLAYFGRPADVSGLSFYADKTEASVVAAFSASAESQAFFGSLNTLAQINTIYQNLFNRAAEPAGLTYWAGEINAGRLSLAQASMGILAGAQNDDKLAVTNKLAAATAFTAALDTSAEMIGYQGTAVITSARAYLTSVDSTAASLTAAIATATLNASVSTVVAAGVASASSSTGTSFTLTSGVDNTSATNITGLIDQNTAANTTWNLSDSVSSSAGTMNLSVITAAAAIAGYNTTGVTTLKIKSIDAVNTATASSFDVGSMTGLTGVTIANSSVIGTTADTLTIGSAASGTSILLDTNGSTQNVTVNYATAATAGAADTVTLAVTGRSGAATIGTGFETVAITGGAAGRLASLTTSTATTVTVTGVDLRVDAALDSTVTSLNASAATGTVNLAAAPGTTFAARGGAGTSDILAVSVLTATHTVTGFETLVATAAATYVLTGATATNLGVGVGAGAVSFTNAAATANTILLGGSQQRTTAVAATGDLTTGGTIGYALLTATGASDTLNIAVNNGGTATTGTMTVGGAITATSIENIAISAADWTAVTFGGLTLSTTTTAVSTVTVAATAANMTFGTIGLTQGTATLGAANVINFGAVTGTTSATVGTTASLTFTGGTGVDTTTIGIAADTATQTYNFGAGNDVVTAQASAGTAATSITNINGEAGDDSITLGASVATAVTFNIDGGAGADTLRITGGTSFIDSLVGVEKLVQVGGTLTTTIAASSTALNNSLEITQISANAVTAFTTTAGQIASIAGVTAIGTVAAANLTLTGLTGAETLTGSSTVGTTITGGAGADVMTGGAAADIFIIATAAASNSTDGIDTISNYIAAADTLALAVNTGGTVNVGDTDPNVFNNTAAVASTGITVTTLLANLQTAGDSLAANAFDQAGDTFSVTISGASLRGTDVIYVVHNTGADTTVTAADTIIALIGTSTGALTVALTTAA